MSTGTDTRPFVAGGSARAVRPRSGNRKRPGRTASNRPIGRLRSSLKDWLDRPMTSWHLVLALFGILLCFGLLMVLSASSIISYRTAGPDGLPSQDAFAGFKQQAVYAAAGLVVFVVAARLPPRTMRMIALGSVLVSLLLLAAVLVFGKVRYGARCWLEIGPVSFQPSELAKLSLAIWMAHKLADGRQTIKRFREILPLIGVFALMGGLIMLEPDLGTLVALCLVFFAALWFGGAPLWLFVGLAVIGIGGLAVLAVAEPYRLARVLAFLHPNDPAYAQDTYQLRQGLFGMGNGGLFGTGLGQSKVKWSWLPNADSDFIFAVIGEELGFFAGSLVVVVLFGTLAYTGLRIARRNVDPFAKILAATCTVWLVGQAAVNIGYVVGLLPVTGITLPMISTGGTSLIVTMGVFGILANLARREPAAAACLYAQGPGRVARFLGVPMSKPGASSETGWAEKRQARRAAAAAKRAEKARRERLERQAAAARRPAAGSGRRPAGSGAGRRTQANRSEERTRLRTRQPGRERPVLAGRSEAAAGRGERAPSRRPRPVEQVERGGRQDRRSTGQPVSRGVVDRGRKIVRVQSPDRAERRGSPTARRAAR